MNNISTTAHTHEDLHFLAIPNHSIRNQKVYSTFYHFHAIEQYLLDLSWNYPDTVKLEHIGDSYEGRELRAIVISSSDAKPRKTIFIEAGIHAREWLAPATAIFVINQLVENPANKELIEMFKWIIVPVLNPDGYEYTFTKDPLWRKTRRPSSDKCFGVDVNRNFDHFFGKLGTSNDPCSNIYPGRKPFSEPETKALRNILMKYRRSIKFFLALHAHGRLIVHPWAHTYKLSRDVRVLDQVATAGANAIREIIGGIYIVGTVPNTINYRASGGSVGYAKDIIGIPVAMAMELPKGTDDTPFQPPVRCIEGHVKEAWVGIKAMVLEVAKIYLKNR